MDKRITDAEAALDRVSWHSPPAEKDLANALSALLTLAKAQEAELARLKAPLGDDGKVIVERLKAFYVVDTFGGHMYPHIAADAASYIERQAAELTAPVDADVEELAEKLEADRLTYEERWRLVSMLRRLSRENAALRELADDAEEMQRDRDDALGDLSTTRVELAVLREGVEKVRADVFGEMSPGAHEIPTGSPDLWDRAIMRCVAILDKHFPKPEGE